MIATEILDVDTGDRVFKLKAVKDIDSLLNLVENDDDVPFWAVLWPAAKGMARFLWNYPGLEGKSILELGAGLGLAGMVAAARGGCVTQTDFVPEALEYCQFNSELNGIDDITRILADWRSFDIGQRFDLVVGSDILYEPTLHPYLQDIFSNNVKPGGRIILSDPGRKDAQEFIRKLVKQGFEQAVFDYRVEDAGLYYNVNVYVLIRGKL